MAGMSGGGFRPAEGSRINTSKGPRIVHRRIINMNIELQPWQTPNYVIGNMPARPRQEGFNPDACPKWSLAETDAETLAKLCDDFRAEVFRKAGKQDPQPETAKTK